MIEAAEPSLLAGRSWHSSAQGVTCKPVAAEGARVATQLRGPWCATYLPCDIVRAAGVHSGWGDPVSKRGINQDEGTVNVYELLPKAGDSLTVVNVGTHFEIRYHHWEPPELTLTDDDIDRMKQGRIVWH